ncbi:hypothetical protein [Microbacterium sp. NPDC091662]|uniref:hypothetical protein n=1 Tax=Microbacterium sp. NPDC091662 TaxID=3364211 RepID=UPI00381D9D5A
MPNEHVLRIIRLIHNRPEGLTAAYDAATDRIRVEWADFPFSPSTGLLNASAATDEQVGTMLQRFLHA